MWLRRELAELGNKSSPPRSRPYPKNSGQRCAEKSLWQSLESIHCCPTAEATLYTYLHTHLEEA